MRHAPRTLIALAVPVLLAVSIPLLFVCCTPQWLPDNSGFVYVRADGVVWYDLKTKKATKIVAANVQNTTAGIWPTGDRVVVSSFNAADKKINLEIAIYDFDGNKRHQSPKHRFEADPKESMLFPTIYASSDKKHVLVTLPSLRVAVSYNIETKAFHVHRDVMPVTHFFYENMAMLFHVSPITPDGNSFLLGSADGKKLSAMSWDGGEPREIAIPKAAREAITKGRDVGANDAGVATGFRWEMGVLTTRMHKGVITLNPRDGNVSYEADAHTAELLAHAAKQKAIVIGEFANGAILQVSDKNEGQIQVWRPDGKKTTVLESLQDSGVPQFIPSPNRELLIVRTLGEKNDQLLVINSKGETVAKIEGPFAKP